MGCGGSKTETDAPSEDNKTQPGKRNDYDDNIDECSSEPTTSADKEKNHGSERNLEPKYDANESTNTSHTSVTLNHTATTAIIATSPTHQDNAGDLNTSRETSPKFQDSVTADTTPRERLPRRQDKESAIVTSTPDSSPRQRDNSSSIITSSSPREPENDVEACVPAEDGREEGRASSVAAVVEGSVAPTEEQGRAANMAAAQEQFSTAVRLNCNLLEPETLLKLANDQVESLTLNRTLPPTCNLTQLLAHLPSLKVITLGKKTVGMILNMSYKMM